MKKLAWALMIATFVGAVVLSAISLGRWEWTRALYYGLVALLAEIAIATGLILRKLGQVQATIGSADDDEVTAIVRDGRTRRHRFAWLQPEEITTRTNVFITMLVGGGVLLSGLAWLIDRIAAGTIQPVAEGRLTRDLARIGYPEGGLLVDDVTVLAQTEPHGHDPTLRALLGRHR